MKKYLALYMAPNATIDAMMKNSTPEEQKKGMDEWMQWAKKHESSVVELGTPTGKNKRVTSGGIADTRNEVCGYSIIQADSHEDAAALFADNPHVMMDGAYVEVIECVDMSGN